MLTVKDYSDAITVQDACNTSGIVLSLCEKIEKIRETSQSTADTNTHPIVVMLASKIHDLAGLGLSDTNAYSDAYILCRAVVRGDLDPVTLEAAQEIEPCTA